MEKEQEKEFAPASSPKLPGSAPIPEELHKLAKLMGKLIKHWGFKNIHGELWTYLYLSPKPLDAKQLMARTGTSKALISISLKDLIQYEVVLYSDRNSSGRQTYVANPKLFRVIFKVLRSRELEMVQELAGAFEQLEGLKESPEVSPKRLKYIRRVANFGAGMLRSFISLKPIDMKGLEELNTD